MEKWSHEYQIVKIRGYYSFWLSHKRIISLGIAIAIGFITESLFAAIVLFFAMPLLGKLSYQLWDFYCKIGHQLSRILAKAFYKSKFLSLFNLKTELEDKIIDAAENNSIIFEA